MKTLAVALLGFTMLTGAAHAQSGTNQPVGQAPANTVNQAFYTSNTDPTGFSEQSEAYVTGAGSTQATATVMPSRVNVVVCAAGTGVMLPAVQRYIGITILNRGTAACLVYPTVGGYLETAPGTLAAVNASYSLAAGADMIFRPAIINGQTEWLQ